MPMFPKGTGNLLRCSCMEHFGTYLLKLMDREAINQTELAMRIGVKPSHVSRLISGERQASKETLVAIARALHVPPEQVMRAAGVLPERSPDDESIAEIGEHFNSLSEDDRRNVLEYVRMLRRLSEEKNGAKRRTRNNAARSET